MNCCDEYGNCRQGRDCPVRTTKYYSNRQIYSTIAVALVLFWTALGLIMWVMMS